MTKLDKTQLRNEAKSVRNATTNRSQKDALIQSRINASPQFQTSQHLMVYVSMRSEVGTHAFISQCLASQRNLYIPYCVGGQLGIFPMKSWEQLERKAFGILEPKDELLVDLAKPEEFPIDLILVPGLAFDLQLNRLGYGKGHYDRLLGNTYPNAYRMALAYADQMVQTLPTHEFDIPMQCVVTERGIIHPATDSATDKS